MKVKNLYVADIRMIQHLRTVNRLGEHYTLTTKPMRRTIIYRNPKSDRVRDVLTRKKYEIGIPSYYYHGEEYVDYVYHYPIQKVLEDSGYDKPNITKRKLLRLINSDSSNLIQKLLK